MSDNERIAVLERRLDSMIEEQKTLKETQRKVERWETYGRTAMWMIILVVGAISQADEVLTTLKRWFGGAPQ